MRSRGMARANLRTRRFARKAAERLPRGIGRKGGGAAITAGAAWQLHVDR